MIYKTSKGEDVEVSKMNDFQLLNSAQKADRILNSFTGVSHRLDGELVSNVERFLEIVRNNLWKEVNERDLNDPVWTEFREKFGAVPQLFQSEIRNFIKQNFIPKER